jgi:hypothetical protein
MMGRNATELTARLVQAVFDSLQLSLKFLVLHRQPTISVLEKCLQILNALVPCKQFALGDASLFFERRVLVDKLDMSKVMKSGYNLVLPVRTCF